MRGIKCNPAMSVRRVNELEREYETAHSDPENLTKLEELHFQLAGLIGENNRHILREYTDRLIARYNTDPEWFYRKGMEDARRLQPADPAAAGL